MSGYHIRQITRGTFGHPSKIQEELDELNDSLAQGNKIMASVELADLYGAVRSYAGTLGLTMKDLETMADATERAFKDGTRQAR